MSRFYKVNRPLVKRWRAQGLRSFIYLDDGAVLVQGQNNAMIASALVRADIIASGFLISESKSKFAPTQNLEWLGFLCDTETLIMSVSEKKLAKVLSRIEMMLGLMAAGAANLATPRQLAGVVGSLIAMERAVGPAAQLMTRFTQIAIEDALCADEAFVNAKGSFDHIRDDVSSGGGAKFMANLLRDAKPRHNVHYNALWDTPIVVSKDAVQEIEFWANNLRKFNGQEICSQKTYDAVCYSDASSTGFAAFQTEQEHTPWKGEWSVAERGYSSTWRELAAVERSIMLSGNLFQDKTVKWYTDSSNIVKILKVGSGKRDLQKLARSIYERSFSLNMKIMPVWIPRKENTRADEMSRCSDFDDWSISAEAFDMLQKRWGVHTFDRFANASNARCVKFNTKYFCSESHGTDAFTHSWGGENNWLCPPISLVAKTLKTCREQGVRGTLVVPAWESAYYWPLLLASLTQRYVVDYIRFYASYCVGEAMSNEVFNDRPTFDTLALRLHFM